MKFSFLILILALATLNGCYTQPGVRDGDWWGYSSKKKTRAEEIQKEEERRARIAQAEQEKPVAKVEDTYVEKDTTPVVTNAGNTYITNNFYGPSYSRRYFYPSVRARVVFGYPYDYNPSWYCDPFRPVYYDPWYNNWYYPYYNEDYFVGYYYTPFYYGPGYYCGGYYPRYYHNHYPYHDYAAGREVSPVPVRRRTNGSTRGNDMAGSDGSSNVRSSGTTRGAVDGGRVENRESQTSNTTVRTSGATRGNSSPTERTSEPTRKETPRSENGVRTSGSTRGAQGESSPTKSSGEDRGTKSETPSPRSGGDGGGARTSGSTRGGG